MSTDEHPARPRMTGDGHPYLGEAESFKVGRLIFLETNDRANLQAF
jgi:hypothetical protein